MKLRTYGLAAALAAAMPFSAAAEEMFTGDTKLACEAVLCLSSGTRPSECTPALTRYFSISARKLSDTIKKRKSFLSLCPTATADDNMRALTDALANGSGRCDVETLNRQQVSLGRWNDDRRPRISPKMPGHCTALYKHPYVQGELPRYVGDPEHGGRWVNASEYDAALAEYNERRKREQEGGSGWNRRNTDWTGNGWNGTSGTAN